MLLIDVLSQETQVSPSLIIKDKMRLILTRGRERKFNF